MVEARTCTRKGNIPRSGSHGGAEIDYKRIGYLVREEDRADIEDMLSAHPGLSEDYIPVALIGEGTFSTVYKAIDVRHWKRNNTSWLHASRQDPWDAARLVALASVLQQAERVSPLYEAIRRYLIAEYGRLSGPEFEAEVSARPPAFVALKRIIATSGPRRIAEEMAYLRDLGGRHHIVPIISALRREDRVIVAFPYFHGADFRDLLAGLRLADISAYMRILLEALAHTHDAGIIHRDVKPSNVLFSRERDGTYRGLLVDFGLAQAQEKNDSAKAIPNGRENQPSSIASLNSIHADSANHGTKSAQRAASITAQPAHGLAAMIKGLPPGYIENDPRGPMRASRAGTRGFRAPEVLFKISRQTTAIDVWSAGVILLTLLTRRYPFFHSTDDCDALAELACIFGEEDMAKAAESYGRAWVPGGLPNVPPKRLSWRNLCTKLNHSWPEVAAIPDSAFDLLDRLLDLDYRTRITALEALAHPFLAS